jgi:hypothetical protein
MDSALREIKQIRDALQSIDTSLQIIASDNTNNRRTTAFVSKKVICQRLNIPAIALDKLIYQGITSEGKSGLVEGLHFCKIDPTEQNSSKFLYDPQAVIHSAWSNFQNNV